MALTQKDIDNLVKMAGKLIKCLEDAQDIVFSVIEDLLVLKRELNFASIHGRLRIKYLVLHVKPNRFEYNKAVYYFKFVGLNKRPTLVTHLSEIAIDASNIIKDMIGSLSKVKQASVYKAALGDKLNGADRTNLLTVRQLYRSLYEI